MADCSQLPDLPAPRALTAQCDRCGKTGTSAVAMRAAGAGVSGGTWRFCAAYWPRARAELDAADEAIREQWMAATPGPDGTSPPPPPPYVRQSQTWADVESFLDLLERGSPDPASRPPEFAPEAVAAQIVATAATMDGPMPARVEAFVRRHGAPAL